MDGKEKHFPYTERGKKAAEKARKDMQKKSPKNK